ncbi:MAG TPA: glycosyltransferase family 4 protein [Gemmatimonadales bacterium]|nr:glycosyltransferase family 4 protein [Gemmatimonadales bacterium]
MPETPHRILLIEGNRDGTVGGSFQCLYDIARHLDRPRFEPVAVFWEPNRFSERLRAEGVEVHLWREVEESAVASSGRTPIGRARRAAQAVGVRARFLQSVGASLVHLNNTPDHGYVDWLPAARLVKRPIVAHARGPIAMPRGRVRRRLVGGFDRIVAISRHIEDTLVRAGIPKERIAQIYDGIDIEALRAASRTAGSVRQSLGIPPEAPLVVMAGNFKRWKGQHLLIDAMARLPSGLRERCHLVLAGATPAGGEAYETELRACAAHAGLGGRACFLGERGDVPALMAAADVVVHASIEPEPFGLVVVEAMALGKPVLASRLGGPAETVTPDTGVLFDPADVDDMAAALAALLTDEPRRRAIGERARVRAEQFSIERNVGSIEQLYGELLGDRTEPPPRA